MNNPVYKAKKYTHTHTQIIKYNTLKRNNAHSQSEEDKKILNSSGNN